MARSGSDPGQILDFVQKHPLPVIKQVTQRAFALMDGGGVWHFAKSLPLCDLSDAVQDAGYQQSDDDKAAEGDEAEKAPSHGFPPTMNKPRSMTRLLLLAGRESPRCAGVARHPTR